MKKKNITARTLLSHRRGWKSNSCWDSLIRGVYFYFYLQVSRHMYLQDYWSLSGIKQAPAIKA